MTKLELSIDEVQAFWAIGCSLEAIFVPFEEVERAGKEGRVQQAVSWSSMGTAETYWSRSCPDKPTSSRNEYAVVPPGKLADDWTWEERQDDRDVEGVLWEPFWAGQHAAIARACSGPVVDVVLEEAARRLVELERVHDANHPLLDWLIAGDALDPEMVKRELATTYRNAPRHLVWGVEARWLHRRVDTALEAVRVSLWRDDYTLAPHVRRMELLRFAVSAVRPLAVQGQPPTTT